MSPNSRTAWKYSRDDENIISKCFFPTYSPIIEDISWSYESQLIMTHIVAKFWMIFPSTPPSFVRGFAISARGIASLGFLRMPRRRRWRRQPRGCEGNMPRTRCPPLEPLMTGYWLGGSDKRSVWSCGYEFIPGDIPYWMGSRLELLRVSQQMVWL